MHSPIRRLPVYFCLEDTLSWMSRSHGDDKMDVSHQGCSIPTWGKFFPYDSIIHGPFCLGDDVVGLVVGQAPFWHYFTQFGYGVLAYDA
eukprot:scaffold30524_cov48-Attheya_sp.AAC.1